MKNKFLIIIIAIISVLIATIIVFGEDKDKYLKEINLEEFKTLINNKKDFVVYVKQTDCSHCKDFTPNYTSVLSKYKIYSYVINLTNLTKDENKEFTTLTGVEGTPTVYFYEDGVKSPTMIEGSRDKTVITNKFKAMGYIKEGN